MRGIEVPKQHWWNVGTRSKYVQDFDYLIAPIQGMEHAYQIKFNPRAYEKLIAR
jgi:hypothetical protein